MTKEEQKEVFREMIRKLEAEGLCMFAYHDLAFVLFGDRLE